MLGGGNPVSSSNPAGIGQSLIYLGKHAYAYSGTVQANTDEAIALKFSTGNQYIVGKFDIVVDADTLGANYLKFKLELDGQEVINSRERRDLGDIGNYPVNLIVPPYSLMEFKFPANGTNADVAVLFTGEVYA